MGAPLRVSQARPRRQRRAPVHAGRRRQAARDETPDGRRRASGQDREARSDRAERDGRCADADAAGPAGAGAGARRAGDAQVARHDVAAAPARQPDDAAGPAAVRARHDHPAQSRHRRRVDARRTAGVRGAPVHRAAAGGAARRDQRVSAPERHAARAADDVSVGTARHRAPDGRGDDGARGRPLHLARSADAARGHPPRGARAQGANRRAVVLGRIPAAPGDRRAR